MARDPPPNPNDPKYGPKVATVRPARPAVPHPTSDPEEIQSFLADYLAYRFCKPRDSLFIQETAGRFTGDGHAKKAHFDYVLWWALVLSGVCGFALIGLTLYTGVFKFLYGNFATLTVYILRRECCCEFFTYRHWHESSIQWRDVSPPSLLS
ncbi:hypothetical protein FQN54_007232 [Arachnomyces sp. PD_36]|nr:hypothetical protein FQN54_007232 [Arachnomyces sp. PD_36]